MTIYRFRWTHQTLPGRTIEVQTTDEKMAMIIENHDIENTERYKAITAEQAEDQMPCFMQKQLQHKSNDQ